LVSTGSRSEYDCAVARPDYPGCRLYAFNSDL